MWQTMLSMRSEVVAFIISNSLKALILLGLFSKCRIVIVSYIGHISCSAFSTCSENVDFPIDVAKSLLCSLNLVLKFLYVLPMQNLLQLLHVFCIPSLFEFVVVFDAIAYYLVHFVVCFQPNVDVLIYLSEYFGQFCGFVSRVCK